MERLKRWGLLFDEREIGLVFPAMQVRRSAQRMILVNGRGPGGTTTLCTGNALRQDEALKALGIELDAEFEELAREVPVSTAHRRAWTPATRRLFALCEEMGLDPRPTPKMVDYRRCRRCGRCVLGCPYGAKWDSRRFLEDARRRGARLACGCRAQRVAIREGRAVGVWARQGGRTRWYPADLVVLAAGGLGTPPILERSGIGCEPRLFVDPVLCVAGPWPGAGQEREVPMPFVVQRPGYIVSPYFDYLSFLFNRRWRHPVGRTLGLMIKLADSERGSVSARRRGLGRAGLDKGLTEADRRRLAEAVELCRDLLARFGIDRESTFLGTLNAGHPGGMLPLTAADAGTLHPGRLPPNLYVADATLLPQSLGNPPILTIMALAMRIGRLIRSGPPAGTGRAPRMDRAAAAGRPARAEAGGARRTAV
jgi:ferredoxin